MNLVIDIGNTRTKAAFYDHGDLVKAATLESFTLLTASKFIRNHAVQRCILSSVKGAEEPLKEYLQENIPFFVNLTHTTPLPFKNLYHTPESLGKDRIAAVAGAFHRYPKTNVLIIDMGTAITYDLLTREAEYAGGNISPGLVSRFRALHDYTARLPLVKKDDLWDDLGSDTRSAIIKGVQMGIVHEINGYLDRYSGQFADLMIILTGGDADFFVNKLKKTIFVVSNLVLNGLNFILEFNAQKK